MLRNRRKREEYELNQDFWGIGEFFRGICSADFTTNVSAKR
jgi:hypothetical protein